MTPLSSIAIIKVELNIFYFDQNNRKYIGDTRCKQIRCILNKLKDLDVKQLNDTEIYSIDDIKIACNNLSKILPKKNQSKYVCDNFYKIFGILIDKINKIFPQLIVKYKPPEKHKSQEKHKMSWYDPWSGYTKKLQFNMFITSVIKLDDINFFKTHTKRKMNDFKVLNECLSIAVIYGSHNIAKFLLEHGVDPNGLMEGLIEFARCESYGEFIQCAIENNDKTMICLLLKYIDENTCRDTIYKLVIKSFEWIEPIIKILEQRMEENINKHNSEQYGSFYGDHLAYESESEDWEDDINDLQKMKVNINKHNSEQHCSFCGNNLACESDSEESENWEDEISDLQKLI